MSADLVGSHLIPGATAFTYILWSVFDRLLFCLSMYLRVFSRLENEGELQGMILSCEWAGAVSFGFSMHCTTCDFALICFCSLWHPSLT
jgi:hypothetical protein